LIAAPGLFHGQAETGRPVVNENYPVSNQRVTGLARVQRPHFTPAIVARGYIGAGESAATHRCRIESPAPN
jgi:hypothetical protein